MGEVKRSTQDLEARRVTRVGAVFNLVLALVKFSAGWQFGSRALMADAVDSLTDLVTDVITLFAYPFSRKPVDHGHPYGHGRVESLSAMIVAGFLMLAAFSIAFKAVQALVSGQHHVPMWPALLVAAFAIVSKEWLYRWTSAVAKKVNSRVLAANAWNHRGDALSSVAVLLGISGSLIIPGAESLDSWASLIVVVFIFRAAIIIAYRSANDLLDTCQDETLLKQVETIALRIEGVRNAHRARVRRYGHLFYVDLDIEVNENLSVREGHSLSHEVKNRILREMNSVADIQIHVEPEGDHLFGEGPVRLS